MVTALLLTLLSVLCIYDVLGPFLLYAGRPLIAGTLAGLIVGHPLLGMAVGATLELTALGVYQYGGATIPDYQTGAIVGTALAAASAGTFDQQLALGLGVGLPAALLLAALDPIGRFLSTFFLHRADRFADAGDGRGLAIAHWTAFAPWALVRAVPTFLGALAAGSGAVRRITDAIPHGFVAGMTLAGAMLPAVGFALLLTVLPVARHWYLLLIGFVLFAYLKVPLLGIALCGLALAALLRARTPAPEPVPETVEEPAPSALTRTDLKRAFRRYLWSFQISWNYERMQALGFAYAMEPVLRRLYPDRADYAAGLRRHLQFFNSAPIVGGPLILGSAIALEESGAPTSAASIKVALMGPLAGIGDTLTFALYNSIVFTLGASWALQGNLLGPAFAGVAVLVPYLLVRRWQFSWAHRQGRRLASRLASGALAQLSESATVLGLVVLGGFVPSIVRIVTTLTYHQQVAVPGGGRASQVVRVQQQLDALLPHLLPVLLTAGVYLLMRRTRLRTVWIIALVAGLGVALGWLGWFAPGGAS
jgi:mannose/fructose/N-acetylgalactosamine-specific phosphotransferase system component IID